MNQRVQKANLWVCGVAMVLAVPLLWLALAAQSPPIYLTAMGLAEFLVFMPTGPVNSAIINAVSANDRAKAMAASILVIHLLGNVPSPPLIGWLADKTTLSQALLLVPAAALVSALIWLGAAIGLRSPD